MAVEISYGGQVTIPGASQVTVTPTFSPITATGGTINDVTVDNVTYRTHTFTSTGILTVTSAVNNIASVEYLVVAGGGGGGSGYSSPPSASVGSGGGGAGGYLTGTINLNVGSYDITVGAGGAGGAAPGSLGVSANSGAQGDPSKIALPGGSSLIESIGGGYGGGSYALGNPGGSGGGGGASATGGIGTLNQGNPGGNGVGGPNGPLGSGGGGAGSAGVNASLGRHGGDGLESFISGYPQFYAGGGGGDTSGDPGSGVGGAGGGADGIEYTGSGGGGNRSKDGAGGNGSGGIVVVRYRIS